MEITRGRFAQHGRETKQGSTHHEKKQNAQKIEARTDAWVNSAEYTTEYTCGASTVHSKQVADKAPHMKTRECFRDPSRVHATLYTTVDVDFPTKNRTMIGPGNRCTAYGRCTFSWKPALQQFVCVSCLPSSLDDSLQLRVTHVGRDRRGHTDRNGQKRGFFIVYKRIIGTPEYVSCCSCTLTCT